MTKTVTLQSLGIVKKNFKTFHFWSSKFNCGDSLQLQQLCVFKASEMFAAKRWGNFFGCVTNFGIPTKISNPQITITPTLVGKPPSCTDKNPPPFWGSEALKKPSHNCAKFVGYLCDASVPKSWSSISKIPLQASWGQQRQFCHPQCFFALLWGGVLELWKKVWIVLLGGEATIEKHSHCLCVFFVLV